MGKEITSFEKLINPNFLNAELIGELGAERTVTIRGFEEVEYYDPKDRRTTVGSAVVFDECKPLLLNKTNSKTLKKLFNPNSDDTSVAIGQQIILYVERVKVAGNQTTGVRIRPYIPKEELFCSECGQVIKASNGKSPMWIAKYTEEQYGKQLCSECAVKAKEEKEQSNGAE